MESILLGIVEIFLFIAFFSGGNQEGKEKLSLPIGGRIWLVG